MIDKYGHRLSAVFPMKRWESVFPSLESRPALWFALTNRERWKWHCGTAKAKASRGLTASILPGWDHGEKFELPCWLGNMENNLGALANSLGCQMVKWGQLGPASPQPTYHLTVCPWVIQTRPTELPSLNSGQIDSHRIITNKIVMV